MRTPYVVAQIVVLASLIAGCNSSDGPSTPTAPTTPTAPAPVATSLSGTVTSSTGGPVPGASVTITDGSNAGRSTTTATNGTYRIDGLTASNGNVFARAGGFDDDGRGAFISGATTLNFTLRAIFFNISGARNSVIDLPRRSTRMIVFGRWSGTGTSNFIVRPVGGVSIVNAILRDANPYQGTHTTTGGPIEIISSENIVEWRFTEVP
jgi:hypothetical protein